MLIKEIFEGEKDSINPLFVEAYVNKTIIYIEQMDILRMIETSYQILEIAKPQSRHYKKAKRLIKDMGKMARNDGISLEAYIAAGELFE